MTGELAALISVALVLLLSRQMAAARRFRLRTATLRTRRLPR